MPEPLPTLLNIVHTPPKISHLKKIDFYNQIKHLDRIINKYYSFEKHKYYIFYIL